MQLEFSGVTHRLLFFLDCVSESEHLVTLAFVRLELLFNLGCC